MDEARYRSPKVGSDSTSTGAKLGHDPRAHGQTDGDEEREDEEREAELLLKMRRKAILDEARENGIIFDLSDCFAKDLDALEAKLATSLQVTRGTKKQVSGGQSEVTDFFCQAHFARVVDLAQAAPVMVTRQDKPLLVILSPERYGALLDGRSVT